MAYVAASMGFASKMSVAASSSAFAVAAFVESHEFTVCELGKELTIVDANGIRGTRSHATERTADGTYAVHGRISLNPTKSLLDLWLARIMGSGPSTNVYSLAEDLPFFDVLTDRIVKRWIHRNCKINKATFKGKAGGMLTLDLDVIGWSEDAPSATAFPAISLPLDRPYMWQNCAATFNSVGRTTIKEFELSIDNHLMGRFSNSQTLTELIPGDRTIEMKAVLAFTSNEYDLYGLNSASAAAASLVFTNASNTLTMALANWAVPDHLPPVKSRSEEILLSLDGKVLTSSTTKELIVTNA